jgi:hypothetical protein
MLTKYQFRQQPSKFYTEFDINYMPLSEIVSEPFEMGPLPAHKRNDCELTFACFSGLRPEIQAIALIERDGH